MAQVRTMHVCFLLLLMGAAGGLNADEFSSALEQIRHVGSEGEGNEEAERGWGVLSKLDSARIPDILKGMDGATPRAMNYLRSAVDAIVERTQRAEGTLPISEIEALLSEVSHAPRARRQAYEILLTVDPKAELRWVETFLQDPSPELRRDSVAHWIAKGKSAQENNDSSAALECYQKALSGAVDDDQVKDLAERLKPLGVEVDVAAQLGLLLDWKVIGPFDNKDEKGFAVAYPPEEKVDFSAKYEGVHGEVAWKEIASTDPMGKLDLNQLVVREQGVLLYLATEFTLESPRKLQVRFGTPNGWKLWVNGKLIFARDEYHSGNFLDQYVYDVDFQAGKNVLLFKCCQNEQTESWAKDWEFVMRVCDASGTAVLSTTRPPRAVKQTALR